MKHYFKKLPVFLYICIALIAYSCSEEKDFVKEENRISTVNLEDLPFLQKELNKYKSKGIFSKESTEYYLDKINPENIIQILDQQGFKSYTFGLNFREQDTLFNLCAKETSEGYNYSLLKYCTTSLDEWIQDIKNTGKSSINPEVKGESIDDRVAYAPICVIFHHICPSGLHDESQMGSCDYDFIFWISSYDIIPCNNGGGGGSSNPGAIGTTVPNVSGDGGENGTDETPCERIIRISNDNQFKINFDTLNNPARFSMDQETGFVESRDANSNKTYTPVIALDGQHSINVPPSLNATSIMHVHTNFGGLDGDGQELVSIKIHSPQDIKTLLVSLQTNATTLNVPLNDVNSVVLSSGGIFAMNLLSPPVELTNTLTYAEWKTFNDEYTKAGTNLASNGNLDNVHVKKMLLQFLKKYHLDDKVALFEATFTASDPTTPKWNRLTLNPLNSNVVVPTPCK